MAKKSFAPSKSNFRKPGDTAQKNGPFVNAPTYPAYGGLTGAAAVGPMGKFNKVQKRPK